MKKLVSMFLLLAAGCSAPGSTEINRPSQDVNGVRQLLLTTSFNPRIGTFASAAYSDSSVTGFGPSVLITCNSDTIIDTRQKVGGPDSSTFIALSTDYAWNYQGPDTTFSLDMPSPGSQLIITEPNVDSSSFVSLFDSLHITYQSVGPCSNLLVILTQVNDTTRMLDTAHINIQFDSATGLIHPIPPQSLSQLNGEGTITVIKVSDSTFSMPSIHSIVVKDSVISQPITVQWN
jgi:hypothetical protein